MDNTFPNFRDIKIQDIHIFKEVFSQYQPQASEWTFANLFIWRRHYRFKWSVYRDWILLVYSDNNGHFQAFQPVGPPSRLKVTLLLLEWLKDGVKTPDPIITRADGRLIKEVERNESLLVKPEREHFDYVYLRDDLISLSGNRYSSKRNHINKLLKTYNVKYDMLNETYIEKCNKLQDKWCQQRRCEEDTGLLGEWEAIKEMLTHYDSLGVMGGVILIEDEVTAFTIGEMLNDNTAVIHIEKADADIPGLYPLINQRFCEYGLEGAYYVNREQDLGIQGLREAKLSYHPHHFVEKFSVRMR
ncbi:MAG TPA: phosphatidylglycerol lysyltransferase domain-containing protein [Syntrophorhabdaceae bacterium]|nr:phosphatidylglycerol lysyltransferase domain-containing protein [Syntrophorhabdaceae bacterium]HOT43139.1 phosphatidylglycerol lysyltransferase domain-containing protein [Syntrophorhabdaceae bacterium]HPP42767.1 phosphatidylglycerol lysyltransferase domain-containing protein [Syntrophorhabdaceae bacterium]HQH44249.1 phosphatidylglycerol lysyltransferase domain-containing protein [Syntrophorhabdaceae bacterium]